MRGLVFCLRDLSSLPTIAAYINKKLYSDYFFFVRCCFFTGGGRLLRVSTNSPNLWSTICMVTFTRLKSLPECTRNVCPM